MSVQVSAYFLVGYQDNPFFTVRCWKTLQIILGREGKRNDILSKDKVSDRWRQHAEEYVGDDKYSLPNCQKREMEIRFIHGSKAIGSCRGKEMGVGSRKPGTQMRSSYWTQEGPTGGFEWEPVRITRIHSTGDCLQEKCQKSQTRLCFLGSIQKKRLDWKRRVVVSHVCPGEMMKWIMWFRAEHKVHTFFQVHSATTCGK